MLQAEFERELCAAFCGGLSVHPVPSGYAVSSVFEDSSGDRISFYVTATEDGYRIEDDGDYLANLAARDIIVTGGGRAQMLDAILKEGRAYWDRDTLEIRTEPFEAADLATRSIKFLSSLIRVRDLALVTRERVRSAFRDDFIDAVRRVMQDNVLIEENVAPSSQLNEFPADIVLRPQNDNLRTAAIYLANSNDKLNESLLAWREYGEQSDDVAMLAIVEEPEMKNLSRLRFQRAQNRGLPMPIFRGDESATIARVGVYMRRTGTASKAGTPADKR